MYLYNLLITERLFINLPIDMNKYNKIKAISKGKEDWDYLGVKIAIRLVFKDGRYNAQLVYFKQNSENFSSQFQDHIRTSGGI